MKEIKPDGKIQLMGENPIKKPKEPMDVNVPFNLRLVHKDLLEEILHELTSIDGLKAFDCKGDGTWEGAHYVQVDKEDLIDLDYHILMGKLKMVLK